MDENVNEMAENPERDVAETSQARGKQIQAFEAD